jgi:hypothetical protein
MNVVVLLLKNDIASVMMFRTSMFHVFVKDRQLKYTPSILVYKS